MNKKTKIAIIIAACVAILGRVLLFFGLFILIVSRLTAEYEVVTDINKYTEVIGDGKWGMSEEIFPDDVDGLNVTDFKYINYNPWDDNYLAYLVIDYETEQDYNNELSRLNACGINEYAGYYGVTGFTNYELVAMNADSYQGFIYAITDGQSEIIYVETVFCNYFTDIDYKSEIPNEYLPDGFDATFNNEYAKNR